MNTFAKNLEMRGNKTSGMDRIQNVPRCSVYRTTTQSITQNTATPVSWDTFEQNVDGMFRVAQPTRIIGVTAGWYIFTGWVNWAASAVGIRQLYFLKNNATYFAQAIEQSTAAGGTAQTSSAQIALDAGDYVELIVFQNTAGALTIAAASATGRENGFQACLVST